MELIDILLLIALLWFGFKGFAKGLFNELFSTLAFFAGFYIAINFSAVVGNWLSGVFSSHSKYYKLIILSITFIGSLLLMKIGVWISDKFFSKIGAKWLVRLGGLVFGLLKGLLITGAIIFLISKFDSNSYLLSKETKENSLLYKPVSSFVYKVYPSLVNFIETKLSTNTLNRNGVD